MGAAIGAFVLLVLAIVCRIRSGKPAKKINWRLAGKIAYGTLSALVLGAGMAMILELGMMLWGVVAGIVGIVMLLCLIPMCVGFRK